MIDDDDCHCSGQVICLDHVIAWAETKPDKSEAKLAEMVTITYDLFVTIPDIDNLNIEFQYDDSHGFSL